MHHFPEKHNAIVYPEMRPPVAADNGVSPLRGKNALRMFEFSTQKTDQNTVIKNLTSDGILADIRWNQRHHATPSAFNDKNKTYCRVSASNCY